MSKQSQVTVVEPIPVLLVTTKQAAEALQVCERTVFNLIATGELPSVKVRGSRRIFTDDLKAFARMGVRVKDSTVQ